MNKNTAILSAIISVWGVCTTVHAASGHLIDVANNYTMNRALDNEIGELIKNKKYSESIAKLDEELEKDPGNISLLFKALEIYSDTEQYYKANLTLDKILCIEPKNEKAIAQKKKILALLNKLKKHEIGLFQDESYLSDIQGYWTYSSLHYFRLTPKGSYGGRINYGNRYGTNAAQYQAEFYPLIGDKVSGSAIVAYSDTSQIIFPNFLYRIEPYFTLPNQWEVSTGHGGQKYITFDNQWLYLYTGTIGKYLKDYYAWYRPAYWAPTETFYSEVGVKKYFSNKYNYVSIKYSTGRLPDIGDLPPLATLVIVRQTSGGIDGGFSITQNCNIKAGVAYTNQIFLPSQHLRNVTDMFLSMDYRF